MIDPSLLVAVTGFVDFVEGDPKYLTVADMERAARIPRKIQQAVYRYLSGAEWKSLDLEKVAFSWKKLSTALLDYDRDDVANMERLIDGLPKSDEISGGYVGAMQRVVNYVIDTMPTDAQATLTGIRHSQPGPVALHRWERCVTVAEEPLYVLEWLHEGRLTTAAMDCLTAMYPPILQMILDASVIAIGNLRLSSKWTLPRAKENQMSLLLGSFSPPGLQKAIQAVTDAAAKEPSHFDPTPAGGSRVAKSLHSVSPES